MSGNIRCTKCRKAMSKPTCSCDNVKVLISLYWQGKHYSLRKDREGDALTFFKAKRMLENIRADIDRKKFDLADWLQSKIKERLFEDRFLEWLDQRQMDVSSKELTPETLRCYRSYFRNHFMALYDLDVRTISFGELEHWKDTLSRTIKIKTKRNLVACLQVFFRWLRKKAVIKELPLFPDVSGDDSNVRVALDYNEQVEALSRIPEQHRDFYEFLFETGLRVGEGCALKVKDIDLSQQRALIQRHYSGSVLLETTKAKNKKWIPLSNRALEIAAESVLGKHPEAFLLINPETKRGYRCEFLRKLWKRCSGLDVTLYEASRHTFCTQIVEGGLCNTLQAKQLMRHADIRSTEKYFHGSISKLKDIVNARGKVIPLGNQKGNGKETSFGT